MGRRPYLAQHPQRGLHAIGSVVVGRQQDALPERRCIGSQASLVLGEHGCFTFKSDARLEDAFDEREIIGIDATAEVRHASRRLLLALFRSEADGVLQQRTRWYPRRIVAGAHHLQHQLQALLEALHRRQCIATCAGDPLALDVAAHPTVGERQRFGPVPLLGRLRHGSYPVLTLYHPDGIAGHQRQADEQQTEEQSVDIPAH